MRVFLVVLCLALAIPCFAAADCCHPCCCCCCSDDGKVAGYEVVWLEAQRFTVFKGTLGDPMGAWDNIVKLAGSQGLMGGHTQAWSLVPTMPDSDPPAPSIPYWSAFTLDPNTRPTNGLEAHDAPGGRFVRAVHRGPYEQLGDTWAGFAMAVVEAGAYDASRPLMEHYVSDPGTTPPEELITHLYIPVT